MRFDPLPQRFLKLSPLDHGIGHCWFGLRSGIGETLKTKKARPTIRAGRASVKPAEELPRGLVAEDEVKGQGEEAVVALEGPALRVVVANFGAEPEPFLDFPG